MIAFRQIPRNHRRNAAPSRPRAFRGRGGNAGGGAADQHRRARRRADRASAEAAESRLAAGEIDILIGTHRLLNPDIREQSYQARISANEVRKAL